MFPIFEKKLRSGKFFHCNTRHAHSILRFVNLRLKLIFFRRLEQLLQDLTGMFGERLVGTDLVAAESVVENIDSLARLVQNVASRQVEVKGTMLYNS